MFHLLVLLVAPALAAAPADSLHHEVDRRGHVVVEHLPLADDVQHAFALATLTGAVAAEDIYSGERLEGVTVTLLETGAVLSTDGSGVYRFENLELGTYTVHAATPGYTPRTCTRTLDAYATFWCSIALNEEPPAAEPEPEPEPDDEPVPEDPPGDTEDPAAGDAPGDDDDDDDDAEDDRSEEGSSGELQFDDDGSYRKLGCATAGGSGGWLLPLLLLGARRRIRPAARG